MVAPEAAAMTDHQAHMRQIEDQVADLQLRCAEDKSHHSAIELQSGLFCRQFQLLSLVGDLSQLGALYDAIEAFTASSPGPSDLWLLQAHIAVKLHRFRETQQILHLDPCRRFCPQGRLVQADLHIQHGRYADARKDIEIALEQDTTWDGLARLAYLTGLLCDIGAADRIYLAAQDELTAKQMHAYAWIEVQRGILDFQRGHYPQALAHYNRAAKAYSGYWLVEERIAEVQGAQGDFYAAIAAYTRLYESCLRPEWAHALGDLYSLSGDIRAAHTWKLKALDGYQASADTGELHYLHYLVELCCELPGQSEAALQWARRDEELRSNYQTLGNLAWALYRCGQISPAQHFIGKALASNVVCARLYLQAACVYAAAGDCQTSARYFQLSKSINAAPVKAYLPVNLSMSSKPARPSFASPKGNLTLLQHS
jgi:tetratricopeptide (TPR) repeat protein